MPRLVKDVGHYIVIILVIAYAMPWILYKLQIAAKFTSSALGVWLINFAIYLAVLIIVDKILHKKLGI